MVPINLAIQQNNVLEGSRLPDLQKNTTYGDQLVFNAKVGITKEKIEGDANVYNLIGEVHKSNVKKGQKVGSEIGKVVSDDNSILFMASAQPIPPSVNASANNSIKMFTSGGAGGSIPQVQAEKNFGIPFDAKVGYYSGTKEVLGIFLDPNAPGADPEKNVLQSVYMRVGDSVIPGGIPTWIGHESHPPYKKFTVKAGEELKIPVTPGKADTGKFYVQIYKPDEDMGYNYIKAENPDTSEYAVPTKGVAEGDYKLNVFRCNMQVRDMGDGNNVCFDVCSGFIGKVAVEAAE